MRDKYRNNCGKQTHVHIYLLADGYLLELAIREQWESKIQNIMYTDLQLGPLYTADAARRVTPG